jgi:hypothetical protein
MLARAVYTGTLVVRMTFALVEPYDDLLVVQKYLLNLTRLQKLYDALPFVNEPRATPT